MNLVKCSNGHFYDGEKYSVCPHCAGGDQDDVHTVPMGGGHEKDVTLPINPVTESGATGSSQSKTIAEVLEDVGNRTVSGESFDDEDDLKTIRITPFSQEGRKEPVVGWLIGLNGEGYGESFKLVTGKNFIGRDKSMDVVLRGDNSVSRQKHAILIFEPKAKIFLVQPGESRELFYLNDEVVLNNQQLKKGDILCIGETKLMFIPLCGEDFDWEKFKGEM